MRDRAAVAGQPGAAGGPGRWQRAGLQLVKASISVAIGLLLARGSEFLAGAEAVKRVNARFWAPLLYAPPWLAGYATTGRDRITVLTIDDDDLGRAELLPSWPPTLDFYAHLIGKVAVRKPKAIFVDVLFLDDRPLSSIEAFHAAACDADANGIRIYLASLPDYRPGRGTSAESKLLERRGANGQRCITPVAPDAIDDPYDHTAWTYPLRTRPRGSPGRDSAALAMACGGDGGNCPPDTAEPMAVIWGVKAAPGNVDLFRSEDGAPLCQGETRGVLPGPDPGPTWKRMGAAVHSVFSNLPPRCPYNRVVPVRALDGMGLVDSEVGSALHNKYLLIGTGFQGQSDAVISPLHGRVPGVHLHAMALDNLLTYGETQGYYRRAGDFRFGATADSLATTRFTWAATLSLVLGITAWSIAADAWRDAARLPTKAAAVTRRRRGARRPAPLSVFMVIGAVLLHVCTLGRFPRASEPYRATYRFGRPLVAIALALVGVGFLFWIGDTLFHVGPLSMIEYLLFPLGVEFLHWSERLARLGAAAWHGARRGDDPAWFFVGEPADSEGPGRASH